MALNVTYLKQAIQAALAANPLLVTATKHGEKNLKTNEPRIAIAERGPDTDGIVPYIGYEIVDTTPLTRDDPTTGMFNSLIFIYAVGSDAPEATYIADEIQSMFVNRPEGEGHKWYFDFTTECIHNRFTKFISRLRFGRQGQNIFNFETDVWSEAVEIRIWWADCGCSNERCCQDPPVLCEIEDSDIEECCE